MVKAILLQRKSYAISNNTEYQIVTKMHFSQLRIMQAIYNY